jgi:hypothetical protein
MTELLRAAPQLTSLEISNGIESHLSMTYRDVAGQGWYLKVRATRAEQY